MTRVAIVTGAARGIGAATVHALTAAGWSVIALDRCTDDARLPYGLGTEDELDDTVRRARSQARGAASIEALVGDAASPADMLRAVEAARACGGLHAVICAAGAIAGGVPLWEMDAEQLDAVLYANLRSALVCARVGIPALLERPQPRSWRFIAVASAAATRGLPMLAAYCAAKAGVAGLVRALAVELRGTGVTANAVSPGSTETPILDQTARLYGLSGAVEFAAQQPIERLIEPAEIAAAIVWLASEATGAVTGATLPVDGGLAV
ncbi:MAG: mycofactocin-coupled SDR family oxidoreductase [Solirubrobacteraceae bacterium]